MKTTQTNKNNSNTVTFEMNGKAYRTDAATLDMLRSIVPAAKATGDSSAVEFAMVLGEMAGRIKCEGWA